MNFKKIIPTAIIFALFTTEAVIHFNIGKFGWKNRSKWTLPPRDELLPVVGIVALFAILSASIIDSLGA